MRYQLLLEVMIMLSIILCSAINAADDKPLFNYDTIRYPELKMGYNDLNLDGIPDTLVTIWNGRKMVYISDNGRLPWGIKDENQDWNAYFNNAFNVDQEPPSMWNSIRSEWGSYTILIDRDNCGRLDSTGDWYYKVIDINGDGKPEAEYFNPFPETIVWAPSPFSSKLHINFNGEPDMSYINFHTLYYENEQRYLEGGKYVMNVHGSGMFMNSYREDTQYSWENPIAWYDFDCNGRTNMVMRAADTHPEENGHRGDIGEFELAFELNDGTSDKKWHSLDMQLTFYNYTGSGFDYRKFIDRIPGLEGMKDAEFLSEKIAKTRLQPLRCHVPYMDGYRLGLEYSGWKGVWLLFDEDDDDCRWEEMFARHEPEVGARGYSDRIGDRFEHDSECKGKGKLYVGKFDGRIHLYHADTAIWDVDYLGLYKGSMDRVGTPEGPEPPAGLRYPRVRYTDTNGNGFIDKIEYMTVEYGLEESTEKIDRVVSLLDFADAEMPHPDACPLIDPRVDSPVTGWSVAKWDGKPLKPDDFNGTSIKDGYDKIYGLYTKVSDNMWSSAWMLYETAKGLKLNKSEKLDKGLKTMYTKDELAVLKDIDITKGYSRHLHGKTRREQYDNGYWLREKVFADILEYSKRDKFTLEKLYYTGRINDLCTYLKTK
ncbi:MAG: hypothetical protein ACYC27_08045 [Armatimonadota bacterium]